MNANKNTNIKEWYTKTFADDELGENLTEGKTFYDLFYALDRYHNIYEEFGIDDSLVRERLFEELSSIMGVDYDEIYEQWMKCEG